MSAPADLLPNLGFLLGVPTQNDLKDQTGLAGPYDFKLEFSTAPLNATGDAATAGPDLTTALEKQLGLKLEKTKIHSDVLVIEHVDRNPTEN